MQFCPECQNKLFPHEEEGFLWNKCKNCSFKEEYKSSLVEKKVYKSSELRSMEVNRYMIHDYTLPRTIHKTCPNRECESHADPSLQEAVILQDPNTIKLLYVCKQCTTKWSYC